MLRYKTIYTTLDPNDKQVRLFNNLRPTFPNGAIVSNIFFRVPDLPGNYTIGNKILPLSYRSVTLTLKGTDNKEILTNYPVRLLTPQSAAVQNTNAPQPQLFLKRLATEIDWQASSYNIADPTNDLQENCVLEMVVAYYTADEPAILPTDCTTLFGIYPQLKAITFSIDCKAGTEIYSLSNSQDVAIPKDSKIVGILFPETGSVTNSEGKEQVSQEVYTSSFLTLKSRNYDWIENYPISLSVPAQPYIPIQPLIATEIDWQASCIKVAQVLASTDPTRTYIFVAYYI